MKPYTKKMLKKWGIGTGITLSTALFLNQFRSSDAFAHINKQLDNEASGLDREIAASQDPVTSDWYSYQQTQADRGSSVPSPVVPQQKEFDKPVPKSDSAPSSAPKQSVSEMQPAPKGSSDIMNNSPKNEEPSVQPTVKNAPVSPSAPPAAASPKPEPTPTKAASQIQPTPTVNPPSQQSRPKVKTKRS